MTMQQQESNAADTAGQPIDESRFQALGLREEELKEIEHIFRENIGDDDFNERTLERIKLPTGGLTVWQIASSEGTKYSETLEGIILQFKRPRAMWFERRKAGEPARPPDCFSLDGEKGNYRHHPPGTVPEQGEPGGDCFSCKFNQPGSHPERPESRAKGCPEKRMLFMLTRDRVMPVVVQLPVTSIGAFNSYKTQLFNEFKRLSRVVTQISLEADENETGDPYSKAVFHRIGDVNEVEKIGMSRYEQHCLQALNTYIEEANRRQLMKGDLDDAPMLGPGDQDGPVPPGEIPSSMQPALTSAESARERVENDSPAGAPSEDVVEGTARTMGKEPAIKSPPDAKTETPQENRQAEASTPRTGARQETVAEASPIAEKTVIDDPFGDSMFDHNEEILAAENAEREPSPPGEPFEGEPHAERPAPGGAQPGAAPTLFQ